MIRYLISAIQLFLPLNQLLFLIGEVDELIQGFLVYVTVLFQFCVALVKLLEELKHTGTDIRITRVEQLFPLQPSPDNLPKPHAECSHIFNPIVHVNSRETSLIAISLTSLLQKVQRAFPLYILK